MDQTYCALGQPAQLVSEFTSPYLPDRLTEMASWELRDNRTSKNSRHNLLAMFRQSVFGRLAGYADVNDAGPPSRDPVKRLSTTRKDFGRRGASESQMGRFETGTLPSAAYHRAKGRLALENRQPYRNRHLIWGMSVSFVG